MKYLIAVAEFNSMITEAMLKECMRGFEEQGITPEVLKVPGAVELPLAIKRYAKNNDLAAAVAIGCVVKGDTDHYKAVCEMSANGIMQVMLENDLPIVFEVLMVDTYQKAESRIDKGYHAAFVATKMASL